MFWCAFSCVLWMLCKRVGKTPPGVVQSCVLPSVKHQRAQILEKGTCFFFDGVFILSSVSVCHGLLLFPYDLCPRWGEGLLFLVWHRSESFIFPPRVPHVDCRPLPFVNTSRSLLCAVSPRCKDPQKTPALEFRPFSSGETTTSSGGICVRPAIC